MARSKRLNQILQQQQNGIMADIDISEENNLPYYEELENREDITEQERVRRGDIFSEAALEAAEIEDSFHESVQQMRYEKIMKAINLCIIAGCIYVVFLIYGVICTQYQYTEEGVIEPTVMTVEEIKAQKSYEVLLSSYLRCRVIYEEILILDYRLGQGIEDPVIIANEYTALLESVNTASTQNSAMVVDPKYMQIQESMAYWIQNDAALYLQYMSDAITNNNTDSATYAVAWRSKMYEDFLQITSNIVATGETIKGIDLIDIKEWNPNDYVYSYINGT